MKKLLKGMKKKYVENMRLIVAYLLPSIRQVPVDI